MCKLRSFAAAVVVVLAAVHSSSQRSTPASPDYVAAVVEYHPQEGVDATTTFFKNVDNYVQWIEEAANTTNNADIIIFPEAGLCSLMFKEFSLVPSPSAGVVPCDDTSGLYGNLRQLSCAAKDNEIYVVVNLSEEFPCPNGTHSEYHEDCPETGVIYYNANVAFDRNGTVIAKYRKFNLFGEMSVEAPPVADLVTFDTDFGVTFGMFICFDLMFENPAIQLVKELNVTDIIFPTAWFSELPFLTAVQAQAAWAYGMDVNFLASGYNTPAWGSAGSSIIAGKEGPLVYVMPANNTTQLLIHSVQKKNNPSVGGRQRSNAKSSMTTISQTNKAYDGFYMKADDMSAYVTQMLTSESEGEIELCHNDLCCTFKVTGNISSDHELGSAYYNRIVVFDGVRTFDGFATGGVQVCAVVSCTNDTLPSCGRVFSSADQVVPTTFTGISIRGAFKSGTATQFPNNVLDRYDVMAAEDFSFNRVESGEEVMCDVTLLKEMPLLTFAIYGRDFSKDGDDVTKPSSGLSLEPITFLVILTFAFLSSFI